MIYRLRKKFIKICMLSFAAVFFVLFSAIFLITSLQTNQSLDMLADVISENDGRFPDFNSFPPNGEGALPSLPNGLNRESPFTTRFFTVRFDKLGNLLAVDIRSVASVTQEEAKNYASEVLKKQKERGWIGDFRYKVYEVMGEKAVVFISGTAAKETTRNFLLIACLVFAGGSLIVLMLVILISKRAVRPTAESYEKQKQFITNANHELKTPLTLIRTNLDIVESEIGKNEWIEDIREETEVMTELVNRLVVLARMDEDRTKLKMGLFHLSDAVSDTVSAFSSVIQAHGQTLETTIFPEVRYYGDEATIRQLISILMDNAVKYCDPEGTIRVSLYGGKHPIITVDNTFMGVKEIPLERLFDRFYRADQARTYGNGFGIGLSIAKAIVEKHHGYISVQNMNNQMIRFRVRL